MVGRRAKDEGRGGSLEGGRGGRGRQSGLHCNGNSVYIFLFWEYLFQFFGILSLQCATEREERLRRSEECAAIADSDPGMPG